ncbi:MAG: JAB domain-containing protein [Eubacterium sp.]|nr:JAB domain-containing protein [Eubacterium sp.]
MRRKKYSLPRVAVRLVKEPPLYSEERIDTPEAEARLLADAFQDLDREVLCVVNLQADLRPINLNIVSVGELDSAPAHPREIMKTSILSNAASVMLVHSHPSGNVFPSEADVIMTDRMQKLYLELGIRFLDHIILGKGGQYFSFAEKDVLPKTELHYESDISSFRILSVAEQKESIWGQIRAAEQERGSSPAAAEKKEQHKKAAPER